jgi:hypothetical protein
LVKWTHKSDFGPGGEKCLIPGPVKFYNDLNIKYLKISCGPGGSYFNPPGPQKGNFGYICEND